MSGWFGLFGKSARRGGGKAAGGAKLAREGARTATDATRAAAGDVSAGVRLAVRVLRSRFVRRSVVAVLCLAGVLGMMLLFSGLSAAEGGKGSPGGGEVSARGLGAPLNAWLAYRSAARVWCSDSGEVLLWESGGEEPGVSGLVRVDWRLVAAVGSVLGGHASGRHVNAWGDVSPPIVGDVAVGGDTDGGRFDLSAGDDRRVGLMHLPPSAVVDYGLDGNGDGAVDPHNVWDAVATAAAWMCVEAAGGDSWGDVLSSYAGESAGEVIAEFERIRHSTNGSTGLWPVGSPLGYADRDGSSAADEVLRSLIDRTTEEEVAAEVDCFPGGCVWRMGRARGWLEPWEPLARAGFGAPVATVEDDVVAAVGDPSFRFRVPVFGGGVGWPVPVSAIPQPVGANPPGWWSYFVPVGHEAWVDMDSEVDGRPAVRLPVAVGGMVYAPASGEMSGGLDDDCVNVSDSDGYVWGVCGVVPLSGRTPDLSPGAQLFLAGWGGLEAAAVGSGGGGLISIGTFACRKIAGSDSWSQHAFGNAVDVGADVDGDGKRTAAEMASEGHYRILLSLFEAIGESMAEPVRKTMSDGSTLLQDQNPAAGEYLVRNAIFNVSYKPGSAVSVVRHDEHVHVDFHKPTDAEDPDCAEEGSSSAGSVIGSASGGEVVVYLTDPDGDDVCPQKVFESWAGGDYSTPNEVFTLEVIDDTEAVPSANNGGGHPVGSEQEGGGCGE